MNRRMLLGGMATISLTMPALAQAPWPDRPIRVVTLRRRRASDIVVRLLAPRLTATLGQPVVVDNRAGPAA